MTARRTRLTVHSISLVGMDGSGKSTQAWRLFNALREQNLPVFVIHPFGWKTFTFLPWLFGSRIQKPYEQWRKGHPLHDSFGRIIFWLEVADNALYVWANYLRCLVIAAFSHEQVWLVSDRSFDDLLIKHQQRKAISASTALAVRRLVPRAETTFWLQTDPAVAKQRDREFPDSYYCELQNYYQAIAAQFGWYVIPTSQRSPEMVFADIQAELGGKQDEEASD